MRRLLAGTTFLGALGTAAAVAMAAGDATPQSSTSAGGATSTSSVRAGPAVVYVPPPPDRRIEGGRIGGGTRSATESNCDARVTALAPRDHVGLTAEAKPTFYFFLSADTACEVDFVLTDRRQVLPVIKARVKPSPKAGIHVVRLADYGVSLAPDLDYDWSVQVKGMLEGQPLHSYGSGQVRRIAVPEGLAGLSPNGVTRAEALAKESLWYDALAVLGSEIDATPSNAVFRENRAALLESEGLAEAAASDRAPPEKAR